MEHLCHLQSAGMACQRPRALRGPVLQGIIHCLPSSEAEISLPLSAALWGNDPLAAFRHNGQCNIVFADGHAASTGKSSYVRIIRDNFTPNYQIYGINEFNMMVPLGE